jgi:hypothetical protein
LGDQWFTAGRFAVVLAVLVCAGYPEVLIGQATFFDRDFAVFGYPLAYYGREAFWHGEVPLWNPLNYCGVPFLAQWNTMMLYPLSLFYLLLPLSWSLGVFCLGHFYLAGMGMYFLAHRWTGNRFAAAVAGLTFSFNALMLHSLMWPNNIAAMGWLPWVLLAGERAWSRGGRWLLLGTLAATMQMLSGAPEVILLTWITLTAMFIGEVAQNPRETWRRLARFLAFAIWVAGLAAAQLLPFLDLLLHSQRHRGFADSTWSMPAWGWANFLVPLYRVYPTSLGIYMQPDQFWISSYYLGIGVMGLALLAVIAVRRPLVWLLGAASALCLVLALGDHGPAYSVLKRFLPGLGFMRFPVKFVILPTVLIPWLAGIFIAHLLDVPQAQWRRLRCRVYVIGGAMLAIVAGVIGAAFRYPMKNTSAALAAESGLSRAAFLIMILLGVIALRQIQRPAMATAARFALLTLLWLDAMTAAPRPNPTTPRWVYEPNLGKQELHLDPPPRLGESRAMLNGESESNMAVIPMTNGPDLVVYCRLALYGNLNLVDDTPKVIGMYSLFPREIGDIRFELLGTAQPPAGFADFLAVSHINTPGQVTRWESRSTHLPWITAGQSPVFAKPRATVTQLGAADFDSRRTVFLPMDARPFVSVSNSSPARVSGQQFAAHQITFDVEASEPAMVVIAQSFYHNWRARVDGKPARLLRANHAFQAVQVPGGGKHHVNLKYEDPLFYAGVIISLISAAVWVGLWFRKDPRLATDPDLPPLVAPQ